MIWVKKECKKCNLLSRLKASKYLSNISIYFSKYFFQITILNFHLSFIINSGSKSECIKSIFIQFKYVFVMIFLKLHKELKKNKYLRNFSLIHSLMPQISWPVHIFGLAPVKQRLAPRLPRWLVMLILLLLTNI